MLHSLSSTWRESEGQTSGNNENLKINFEIEFILDILISFLGNKVKLWRERLSGHPSSVYLSVHVTMVSNAA